MSINEFPPKPRLGFGTLIAGTLLFILFIVWTAIYQVEELTRVPGTIEPRMGIAPIQISQGGIITSLDVHDGQSVRSGDILLRIEAASGDESLESFKEQLAILQGQKRRIQGLIAGREPDFSGLSVQHSVLVQDQRLLYFDELAALRASLDVYASQKKALELSILERDAELEGLGRQIQLLREQLDISKNLSREGMSNRTDLIGLERELEIQLARQSQLPLTINRLQEEMRQVDAKRREYLQNLNREYVRNLARINEELRILQVQIDSGIKTRLNLEIRSPIDGVVNGLKKKRAGEIARANELLMEIIPDESAFRAVVRIPATSMGYLKAGLPVQVTFDAYQREPEARMAGILGDLSSASLMDAENKPYYQGIVEVDASSLSLNRGKFPIMSGMTINCSISTGKRSLLQYLLNTILQSYNNAFKER